MQTSWATVKLATNTENPTKLINEVTTETNLHKFPKTFRSYTNRLRQSDMHSKHGWNIGERRKNILFYSSFVVLYPEHTSIVLRLKLLTYTTYWTITTKLWLTMLISLSHKKEIKRFRSQRIPPCHEGQVNRLVCHCITPAYNNGLWMRIWTCEAKIKKERITDE